MNFDERLERLAERDRAVAQSVEMPAVSVHRLQRISEKKYLPHANPGRGIDDLTDLIESLTDRAGQVDGHLTNTMNRYSPHFLAYEAGLQDTERGS